MKPKLTSLQQHFLQEVADQDGLCRELPTYPPAVVLKQLGLIQYAVTDQVLSHVYFYSVKVPFIVTDAGREWLKNR